MAEDPTVDPFSRTADPSSKEFGTYSPTMPGRTQTFGEFKDEPIDVRARLYASIGVAIILDLDAVTDEMLQLYGYGIYTDLKAFAYADGQSALSPFYGNLTDVPRIMHEQDPQAAAVFGRVGSYAGRDALMLPVTAITALAVMKGGAALSGASVAPSLYPVAGEAVGIGSVASTATALKMGILAMGSAIAGVPMAVTVARALGRYARRGAYAGVATGVVGGLALSPLSNYFDEEGNCFQEWEKGRKGKIVEEDFIINHINPKSTRWMEYLSYKDQVSIRLISLRVARDLELDGNKGKLITKDHVFESIKRNSLPHCTKRKRKRMAKKAARILRRLSESLCAKGVAA